MMSPCTRRILFFLQPLLVFVCFCQQPSMACPTSCICKWKGGKQSVECVNKSMQDIPGGIDAGTQVLDFSGNNLKQLNSERFQKVGLINLQKIFMPRCRITHIDDKSFRGLSNLVELDLSNNIITAVPTTTFPDYPTLMKLYLNGNPLKVIRSSAFRTLQYLVSLELSRCQLEVVESNAFAGLNSLEWLKLDHNSLKYIPGPFTLPKGLHGAAFQHNPWVCDCYLLPLYLWLNETKIPETRDLMCAGPPRLRGAPVKFLDENELACVPDVTPTSLYLEISEGKNVSLLCKVHAVPEAKVSWKFQDRILQNDSIVAPGVHLYYYLEEGTVDKKSELFIVNTNAHDNGTFVCLAENQAGKSQSNYTIRIVLKEEPLVEARRMPIETVLIISVAAVSVGVISCVSLVVCFFRYRVTRRKRRRKEKNKKELAMYGDRNTRRTDDNASPIVVSRETELRNSALREMKVNGMIHLDSSQHLQQGGGTSDLFAYPPYSLVSPSSSSEQNPDLITDAEKESRIVAAQTANLSGGDTTGSGKYGVLKNSIPIITSRNAPGYSTPPPIIPQCGPAQSWMPIRDNTNQVVTTPPGSSCSGSVIVCYNHLHQPTSSSSPPAPVDLHLTPNNFASMDGGSYPPDYGLPKLATHYPPIMPATAFYRTLPHRRHNAPGSGGGGVLRYAREAEFLPCSSQPPSYEHYNNSGRPVDVRYNVEGYPKNTPHVTFSDTVRVIEKGSSYLLDSTSLNNKSTQVENDSFLSSPGEASLINASAQTVSQGDSDLSNTTASGKPDLSAAREKSTPRNSKSSPDEGYVGDSPDPHEI